MKQQRRNDTAAGSFGMVSENHGLLKKPSNHLSIKQNNNHDHNYYHSYSHRNNYYNNTTISPDPLTQVSHPQESIAINREVQRLSNSVYNIIQANVNTEDKPRGREALEHTAGERFQQVQSPSSSSNLDSEKLGLSLAPTPSKNKVNISATAEPSSKSIIIPKDVDTLQKTGLSLDTSTRTMMESHFGHNFSHVRVHTDGRAERSAQSVDAAAYTIGNHIVFNTGRYAPNTIAGQRLLAHELTHVVQQQGRIMMGGEGGGEGRAFTLQRSVTGVFPIGSLEEEAQQTSIDVQSGRRVTIHGRTASPLVQKQEQQAEQTRHWWEDILDFVPDQIWKLVKEFAPELEPTLREIFQEGIGGWLTKKIFTAIDNLINTLLEPVHAAKNVIQTISTHFTELLKWIQEAAAKLAHGDCSAIIEAIEKIEKVAEGIASPIIDRVKGLASSVGKFFTGIWDRFGAPIWDWLKSVGGQAWEKIQQFGSWLWEKTAGIRNKVKMAWNSITDKLGIGRGGAESHNGIMQWIQDKASAAWNIIKDRIEPIKKPLMVVAGVLVMLSPAGPLIAIGASVFGLIKGISWVRQQLSAHDGVVKNRGVLQNIIIPQIMGAIRSFTAKLQEIANSISSKINSIIGGMAQVVGAVSSSIISFAVRAVQWIADQFQSLADWANEKLITLADWASTGLERLVHFLQPVFDFLRQIGEVVFDVFKLPFVIAGKLWNMIPACIRDPFVHFLTEHILKRIPIFSKLLAVPNIWEKIKAQVMHIIHLIFKEGNLTGALLSVFKLLLDAFSIPVELVTGIFTKAATALDLIIKDPIGFLVNVLGALKLGFSRFFGNIVTHLINGVVDWLFSGLAEKGIHKPADLTFMSIFKLVLEILDISLETIFSRLEKKISPEKVRMLRTATRVLGEAWEWISILVKEGPGGLWRKLTEQLSNLWSIFIDTIIGWISDKIIKKVTPKLLSFLDATGIMPVINGIIGIYNAINSAVKYVVKILHIVNSILDTTIAIATGSIGPAAQKLEGALDASMPVVIGFLADQLGLDDASEAINGVVDLIRARVYKAIDWLIDKALQFGRALLESLVSVLGLGDKKKDKFDDPEKQARWDKGVAEVNKLKAEYEKAPFEQSILDNKLQAIKVQFAFTELEDRSEKDEFDIYGSMSPATLIAAIHPVAVVARDLGIQVYNQLVNAGYSPTGSPPAIKPNSKRYPTIEIRSNGDIIGPYNEIRRYAIDTRLTSIRKRYVNSLEVHHLLEDRLMKFFDIPKSKGISVTLSWEDHAYFSSEVPRNLPRQTFYDIDVVYDAHVQVYQESGHGDWVNIIRTFLIQNRAHLIDIYKTGNVIGTMTKARRERVINFLNGL